MEPIDLVAFGDVVVDQYFAVDAERLEGKQRAEYLGAWAGGMAGNVAALAAAEGLRTAVVASVGTDTIGDGLLRELADRGVGVRGVSRRRGASGRTVIARLPDGERIIFVAAGVHATPPLDALATVLADRPRAVYTAALDLPAALRVATAAAEAGIPVVADMEAHEVRGDPVAARELAGRCTLVACDERTSALLGPRRPATVRVVLAGARGLTVEDDAGSWSGSPPTGAVVDATGGGDAAIAGACAGLLAGEAAADIGARALAAAASVVGRLGVRARLDEVVA
jgi:sugar/nucleoside kinase (ribokinase family)